VSDDRYDDEGDRPRRARRYDDEDDRRYDRPPPRKSTAWVVFMVLGIVGAVLLVVCVGGFFLLMPAVTKVREASARMQTSNNLKVLALGAHNYESAYDTMPGPFVDTNDRGLPPPSDPKDRLSWRVELLPYMEQEYLYRGIDRSQAWDSPVNKPFTGTAIKTLGDPNDPTDNATRFRCFYDNGAFFSTDKKDRVSIAGVKDGAANTILFVETTERVPWAQFNELPYSPSGPMPQLGHPTRDVFLVAMADGSVKPVKKTVSEATLRAAITRAGKDTVGADW
jgi:hypothetical protein